MDTELRLTLAPYISRLIHPACLDSQVGEQTVAHSQIEAISVEELHSAVVANSALAINENLVVQGKIQNAFFQFSPGKRHVDEDIVSVPRSEILIRDPSLFITKAVGQIKARPQLLRDEGFLIHPVFVKRFVRIAESTRGNVCVAESE